MASLLYTLGRFAFRHRRLVALAWVALLVAVGFAAASVSGPTNSPLTVPGTESQRAFDLIAQRFPGSAADGATARVVFHAPAGQRLTTPANTTAVQRVVARLRSGSPQVASVTGPFDGRSAGGGALSLLSQNGAIGYAVVSYKTTGTELTDATVDSLKRRPRTAAMRGSASRSAATR
jgi:RND superfamily putative drug exporter